jgi:hypothetical protein
LSHKSFPAVLGAPELARYCVIRKINGIARSAVLAYLLKSGGLVLCYFMVPGILKVTLAESTALWFVENIAQVTRRRRRNPAR